MSTASLLADFTSAVTELEAVVGEGKAFRLLDDKLRTLANPITLLYNSNRFDILMRYLDDGSRVSRAEIDRLATQQTSMQIKAALADIKKELGA